MLAASAVALSAALLLAMILNLTLKPRFYSRLMSVCMIAAVFGGLLYYGVGYAETTGDLALSFVRTPLTVSRMFVGINDYSAISGSTLLSTRIGRFGFWAVHLLAFYSMTSAVLNTLAAEAMRALRMLLSRRGELTLIYGVNDDSIALGKECLTRKNGAVFFVAEKPTASETSYLNDLGLSVIQAEKATDPDDRLMRKLRLESRKLTVFALERGEGKNYSFAEKMKQALERIGASPANTRLTLPGEEEILLSRLQVSENAYGFGYVNVYEPGRIAARVMLRLCPPWDCLTFDENGRTTENFECAVVGFGRLGQAVLCELVKNGQFVGSSFRAAVFSPNFESESGFFQADCPGLLSRYHITGYAVDGRSTVFYDYIDKSLRSLKMIVVCTGSDEMDREISDHLMLYLNRRNAERIRVVRVGHGSVCYQKGLGGEVFSQNIFTLSVLSPEQADCEAILLNAIYDGSDRSDWEKWVACDSFSKMSSRASADFFPALVKASGRSAEEILSGSWPPPPETLQVLGQTEHLRWSAFHYVMGFRTMSREQFEAQVMEYLRCRAGDLPWSGKLSRDLITRTHACLIPWDELDGLSARVSEVTGRETDYKQMDINNVLALPLLLQACRDLGEQV